MPSGLAVNVEVFAESLRDGSDAPTRRTERLRQVKFLKDSTEVRETMQSRRELALSILGGRPKVDGKHRLGGHKTQRIRRSAEGSGDAENGS